MVKRVDPGPGQESVWDYPRPPRVEPVQELIKVIFNGKTIAETTSAYRVLETSHPPTYYIPQVDINMQYLRPNQHRTVCEFKGAATYWDLIVDGQTSLQAGWSYPNANPAFHAIKDHISFYASRVSEAFVGSEKVLPQAGDFYGGWITSRVVGPFKGEPGTKGW